ncbi:MAG TPA: TldD/PmbA family protein [Chthonomonadales bacterium]|nr:TldD/PmbA family protein [Chthonomonadales bacterium]
MRDRLAEALRASTADYAEIRFETEDATHIAFRGPEAENVSSSRLQGGIVRACVRGGWGMAAFDSVDALEDQVREACRCAALVGRETTELAPVEAPADMEISAKLEKDFRGVPLSDKSALVARYNDILLRSAPRIESSYIAYYDSFRTVHFASTEGRTFMEERPKVTLAFGSIARDGALVQQAFDGYSSSTSYGTVLEREGLMEEVAARASALLSAPPCEGGVHTVVLDNRLAGVFAHEAFGHLSEADFLYENPKMRDLMHLGRRMGVPALSIVDDGTMGTLIGTNRLDDEGTPTARTDLIRDGVLVGHLHSRETAAKMGEAPTGNARAIRRNVPPIVRMTNTYIEPGGATVESVIGGVDRGIYACRAHGGQTMMEMFTFSAAYGFRIENGKVGELVRDVVLTGNVFETLDRIDGFANDLMIFEGAGGCGKGHQFPLPVTFGSPHIRIRDVVVGGK